MDRVAVEQGFLRVFLLYRISVISPMLRTLYMFLLPAGQTGEAWEPFKQQCCVETQGALDRKVLSFLLLFLMLNHFNFENLYRSREDGRGGLKWWRDELMQPVTHNLISHVNKRFCTASLKKCSLRYRSSLFCVLRSGW